MDLTIVATYTLCDDLLIAFGRREDAQTQMSDAEVMTTAIVAALYFGGNHESARHFLKEHGYIPNMLSKSRFNRRLHRIEPMFLLLFAQLAEVFKQLNEQSIYVIDTYPIPVCDNIRIPRSRIYHGEAFRGYQSSKKRYFYGVKLHLCVTSTGQPVEFFFTPASVGDVEGLWSYQFDLPSGAVVYADKAYCDYRVEDALWEAGIELKPIRKKNLKRQYPPWVEYIQQYHRKRIETTNSLIHRLMPKSIHVVTAKGFLLKLVSFIVASSINFLAF